MENFEDKSLEEMQEELLKARIGVIVKGGTIAESFEIDLEKIEPLYTLAYNHYTAGNYDDAQTLFKALCLYHHTEFRFWMGLAGTRQALGEFASAIEAYSMAGLVSALGDPTPFVYACICHMKLGDMESAKAGLESALLLGADNPKFDAIRQKGEVLLEAVKANLSNT